MLQILPISLKVDITQCRKHTVEEKHKAHRWKGEKWTECIGPPRGEKENCIGARSVTLSPSGGTAATVSLLKEHLSTRPPSEPTKNVSRSQGESATEVTPIVVLPRVFREGNKSIVLL